MSYKVVYSDSLSHHGILGQKWGVRRYQNEDGTLTEAGKKRYTSTMRKDARYEKKNPNKAKIAKALRSKAYTDQQVTDNTYTAAVNTWTEEKSRSARKNHDYEADAKNEVNAMMDMIKTTDGRNATQKEAILAWYASNNLELPINPSYSSIAKQLSEMDSNNYADSKYDEWIERGQNKIKNSIQNKDAIMKTPLSEVYRHKDSWGYNDYIDDLVRGESDTWGKYETNIYDPFNKSK